MIFTKKKIDDILRIDINFDIGKKSYTVNKKEVIFYYVSSLVNSSNIANIVQTILILDDIKKITNLQVAKEENVDNFITNILSGMIGIYSGGDYGYLVDTRNYPSREPQEPDSEKVVRGSRDGFTENIIKNCGLLRRRIKTPNLSFKLFKIGAQSKTDVCLCYINGITDSNLVIDITKKLESIETSEVTMADKALEEMLILKHWNPYPLVRYTERPDTLAIHLFQGKVGIIVDNSPSAIIAPTTFFDHIEHAEEFRQRPIIGTFLKIMRFIGINLSLFLMPIWLFFAISPNLSSVYINTGQEGSLPLIVQILIIELGIEFIRMAAIHTPTPLSTSMGMIAGILIGEIAINVGFFSPEIVLYTAISQIGSYATPSYELALANKVSKIFFLVMVFFLKIYGLIGGILLWFIMLIKTKSFKQSYLYPLFPFNFKYLARVFIRFPHK